MLHVAAHSLILDVGEEHECGSPCRFKVQLCGDIQAEPGFALPTKLLKRELCLFLFLRASKRNPAEKFMNEVEELSWKELQSLSRADFPTLWALVDFVRRVDT